MAPSALRFAHLLAGVMGVGLVILAVLLTEVEERTVRDRVETWWIRLDDRERTAHSMELSLFRRAAAATLLFIDGLWGPAFLSLQAAGVATTMSLAFIVLVANLDAETRSTSLMLFAGWLFFVGTAPLAAPRFRLLPFAISVVFFGINARSAFTISRFPPAPVTMMVASLCLALLFDALLVVIARRVLSRVHLARTTVTACRSIGLLVVPGVLSAAFIRLFPVSPVSNITLFHFISTVLGMSLLGFAVELLFFGIVILATVHYVVWQCLKRPLYAMQRFGLSNRAFLWSGGLALLAFAFGPSAVSWLMALKG